LKLFPLKLRDKDLGASAPNLDKPTRAWPRLGSAEWKQKLN